MTSPPPKLTTWSRASDRQPFDADHHNRLVKYQNGELAAPQTWTASDGTPGMVWDPDASSVTVGGTLTLTPPPPGAPAVEGQVTTAGQAKGIAVFAGATGVIATRVNTATVARSGLGVYLVTWTTAFAAATYAVVVTTQSGAATLAWVTSKTVTAVGIACATPAGAAVDPTAVSVVAFGTLS